MTDVIRVKNLTKKFGGVTAVDHIDFTVKKGEIFGLVGPDGAGKTTTIRLLTTILEIDEGQAGVGNFDVAAQASSVRGVIGYMSQRFTLYADLTVSENLNFFARLHGVTGGQIADRTSELLAFSRLKGFENRLAGRLSGGMQQKLALASTLIHRPKVLFLDEPTTGVDPVSRREFWRILTELNRDGTTLFITTPYMDEAERCHRVAFMDKGALTIIDTPYNIKQKIGGVLLEVEVEEPRQALARLKSTPAYKNSYIFGELLQVAADDEKKASADLRRLLAADGLPVLSIRRVPASMENAFVMLAGSGKISRPGGADA